MRWNSIWRETVASSVCHRILSGRYDCTYGLPLFHAKSCFISPHFLCSKSRIKISIHTTEQRREKSAHFISSFPFRLPTVTRIIQRIKLQAWSKRARLFIEQWSSYRLWRSFRCFFSWICRFFSIFLIFFQKNLTFSSAGLAISGDASRLMVITGGTIVVLKLANRDVLGATATGGGAPTLVGFGGFNRADAVIKGGEDTVEKTTGDGVTVASDSVTAASDNGVTVSTLAAAGDWVRGGSGSLATGPVETTGRNFTPAIMGFREKEARWTADSVRVVAGGTATELAPGGNEPAFATVGGLRSEWTTEMGSVAVVGTPWPREDFLPKPGMTRVKLEAFWVRWGNALAFWR